MLSSLDRWGQQYSIEKSLFCLTFSALTELHKMYLKLFDPVVFKQSNKYDIQYCKPSSEFRGSRGLCDSEVQPGKSSHSEPAPL